MAFVTPLEISSVNITFQTDILRIIDILHQHHILEEIFARDNVGASANIVPDTIYESNNSQYDYFIIPIVYENAGNNVWLVFSTNNIYLQGFLINNDYYYFRDAELIEFIGIAVGQISENYNSIPLRFTGHYSELWTQRLQNRNISWQNVVAAFNNLRNYNNSNNEYYQIIRESLALVMRNH